MKSPEDQDQGQQHGHVRTRLRSTCIDDCSNYPDLKEEAETAQAKVNAAIDSGQRVVAKSVKIICPYDPTLECPGFVHAPAIQED